MNTHKIDPEKPRRPFLRPGRWKVGPEKQAGALQPEIREQFHAENDFLVMNCRSDLVEAAPFS